MGKNMERSIITNYKNFRDKSLILFLVISVLSGLLIGINVTLHLQIFILIIALLILLINVLIFPHFSVLLLLVLLIFNPVVNTILPVPYNDLWKVIISAIIFLNWLRSKGPYLIKYIKLKDTAFLIILFVSITIILGLLHGKNSFFGISSYILFLPVGLYSATETDNRKLKSIINIFVFLLIMTILIGLYEQFSGIKIIKERYVSVLSYNGIERFAPSVSWETLTFATALAVVFPWIVYYSLLNYPNRFIWIISGCLVLFALLISYSRGPLLASIIASIIVIVKMRMNKGWKSKFLLIIFAILIFTITIIILPQKNTIIYRILSIFTKDSLLRQRMITWLEPLYLLYKTALLGIGPGWFDSTRKIGNYLIITKHSTIVESQFIKILGELGIVGFMLFILITISIVYNNLKEEYYSANKDIIIPITCGYIALLIELLVTAQLSAWLINGVFWFYTGILLNPYLEINDEQHKVCTLQPKHSWYKIRL